MFECVDEIPHWPKCLTAEEYLELDKEKLVSIILYLEGLLDDEFGLYRGRHV